MADSIASQLPSDFEFLQVLGKGGFGKVLKCLKKDSKQIVAIKIPTLPQTSSTEVDMLEKLMHLKLDQHNIIKFFGWFHTSSGKAMVFEPLDMSVEDYILKTQLAPMYLSDIRTIIQQLATAFNALKGAGLIHTDLKPDNIMIVDHRRRPLRVKLIDFGLAMHRSRALPGMALQTVSFRAPEIILGLPFTEAIDMWALGCVLSAMLHGVLLFLGQTEYEALRDIIAFLGMPADHLLNNGIKTKSYFIKAKGSWKVKTLQQFQRGLPPNQEYKPRVYHSLDDFRQLRLEPSNIAEAEEREQCIDLLEAMLKMDEAERITPSEILFHPFIVKGQSHSEEQLPAGVIMVRPAADEDLLLLDCDEDISEDDSIHPAHRSAAPSTPPGVIQVKPASVENTLQLEEEDRPASEEPPATAALEKDDSIHQDHSSPASSTPPGVIQVKTASMEDTQLLEEEDRPASLKEDLEKTSSVEVPDRETTARTHDGTQKKEKKKRNCVRRLFSWMKRTFGSCCVAVDEDS